MRALLQLATLVLLSSVGGASAYSNSVNSNLELESIMGRLMWTEVSKPLDAPRGAKQYDVCASCKHQELDTVPWARLKAGDVVNIFHRAEPYRSKLMLTVQGTEAKPIIINGVTDAQGNRPTLDFRNARNVSTRGAKEWGNQKWPLDIYGGIAMTYSRDGGRYGDAPEWIEIRNLRLVGAQGGETFTRADGSTGAFAKGSNAIWAQMARHITIQGCVIEDNDQGVFVNFAGKDTISSDWTLRGNYIHRNGVINSWLQHNLYIQSGGKNLYEWNYVGQVRKGSLGGSLKDRSSGVTIRHNVIVGSARMIDLVETQGGQETMLRSKASTQAYRDVYVYNNFLFNDQNARGAAAPIHFGYDTGSNHPTDPQLFSGDGISANQPLARNGTLYFFNNTYIFKGKSYRSFLFDLGGAGGSSSRYPGTVDYRNNVLVTEGNSRFAWLRHEGTLALSGENLHHGDGLYADHGTIERKPAKVKIQNEASLTKGDPKFDAKFRVPAASPVLDLPVALPPELQPYLSPDRIGADLTSG